MSRHDSCQHGVSAITTLCRWVSGSRHFEGTWKSDSFFWNFHTEDGSSAFLGTVENHRAPATHRHFPEDPNTQLHQLRKVTLSRFVMCCFPSSLILSFTFSTLGEFLLVVAISDPCKISYKLITAATQTICVPHYCTIIAIVTLHVLAGWSRTLPTPHEHLRCETKIECSPEAELRYAVRVNLLSVGVLEWPVCKQQDEQLAGLDSIPSYLVCLVNEHCAVVGNDAVLVRYGCRAKARSIT
jgi:hypothetical protein